MGIPGLLKHVNSVCKRENIYYLCRGKRLGIDGHVWLHTLAYSSAQSIVVDKNFRPLAQAFLQQCFMVQGHGVELIFVFDGAPTPAKQVTDQGRQARRAKAVAQLHLDQDPDPKTLRAAVSLGWPAVEAVINLLREHGIPYIVAPYEADAQLALLCRQGLIWAAATVDSDFIVHGLSNIFFRVNWRSGRCHFYRREVLENPALWPAATSTCSDLMELVKDVGLEALLCFGLLVGCDYVTKIKGVGPKLAVGLMKALMKSKGSWVLKDAFKMVDEVVPLVMTMCADDSDDAEGTSSTSPELRKQCRGLIRHGWNERQGSAWKQKARDAITVFRNALAFDPTSKQVITAAGVHNSIALIESPFLGVAVIPDEIAEARSLGLLNTKNEPVQLQPVSQLRTASMDVALTEDMIEGATLRALPWPADYRPTVDQMKQWLRTRHMPMMSRDRPTWRDYAKVVQEKLQQEAEQLARGEPIRLRDPSGRSLVSHILQRNPNEAWTFAADSNRDYDLPADDWTYDMNSIQHRAPAVDMHLLKLHWEHRLFGAGNEGSRTLLDEAFGRVKEIPRLTSFAMHDNPPQRNPELGRAETSVLFKFSCPASYKVKDVYHVWTECRVSSLPGFHPFVCAIDACGCTCPIGSGADCVHLLMLLLVLHVMPRPSHLNVSKPCTSIKCAWINPGSTGEMYDVTTPIYMIPFTRDKIVVRGKKKKKKKAAAAGAGNSSAPSSSRSVRPANDPCGLRALFDPRPKRFQGGDFRNHPAFIAVEQYLWDVTKNDLGGEPCAAELTWGRTRVVD